MAVKYENLKAGDEIYLYHDLDPCLFGQKTYIIHEENGAKYIQCLDGKHFLDGMTDENGIIPEFDIVGK